MLQRAPQDPISGTPPLGVASVQAKSRPRTLLGWTRSAQTTTTTSNVLNVVAPLEARFSSLLSRYAQRSRGQCILPTSILLGRMTREGGDA